MLIPFDNYHKNFKEGDIVVLLKDYSCNYFIFTTGHEFTMISKDKNNKYIMKDEISGIIVKNIEKEYITIKIDYKTARLLYTERTERYKFFDFIRSSCHHKETSYEDRDSYDSCKLMKSRYNNACKLSFECINHISKEKINKNDFILVYLRKHKIKKLISNQN